MRMAKISRVLAVGVLSLAILAPAGVQAEDDQSAGMVFLYGTGAVVSSLVYGSAKILYGVLGTAVGGLAFVLTGGRSDTARAIMQPALRGDYVVTPDNLLGKKVLRFAGRDPQTDPYASSYGR